MRKLRRLGERSSDSSVVILAKAIDPDQNVVSSDSPTTVASRSSSVTVSPMTMSCWSAVVRSMTSSLSAVGSRPSTSFHGPPPIAGS